MTISVAIIGAGFAGIGAAIRLKDRGITDFVIYERDTRVGGTWRDNTYPGAACDIPSHLYSYSFAPKPDWSHTYSGSAEILDYIDHMVESSGVAEHIRFGHTVDGVAYRTTYNHLSSRTVNVGQMVTTGQSIGLVGTTGTSTGCHLHFEVERNGTLVDPANYL